MSELDDLFAQARRTVPDPSAELMARIMADAAALQPQPRRLAPPRPEQPAGFWSQVGGLFGGFGVTLAGLSTAAAAGVLIGFVQPAPVAALTAALLTGSSYDSVELIPTLPTALTGE